MDLRLGAANQCVIVEVGGWRWERDVDRTWQHIELSFTLYSGPHALLTLVHGRLHHCVCLSVCLPRRPLENMGCRPKATHVVKPMNVYECECVCGCVQYVSVCVCLCMFVCMHVNVFESFFHSILFFFFFSFRNALPRYVGIKEHWSVLIKVPILLTDSCCHML